MTARECNEVEQYQVYDIADEVMLISRRGKIANNKRGSRDVCVYRPM